jgi:chitin disaccharide deacetylase
MLIVNADDWGRTSEETDAAMCCYAAGGITSVSAMVFMVDSERAAEIANGCRVDVGLHLNLSQRFTGAAKGRLLDSYHEQIVNFLTFSKYSRLLYHPALKKQFAYVFKAQVEEFQRIYGRPPSHIDGHRHLHLSTNILLDGIMMEGERVRRHFSFMPGEKGFANRAYRRYVDRWLARRYLITDYFFSLSSCLQEDRMRQVMELAKHTTVELSAHPIKEKEYTYLTGGEHVAILKELNTHTRGCNPSGQAICPHH